MDDLRSALRPLVERPAVPPPPLAAVAARAARRRARRRATAGAAAVVVVGALGLAGVTSAGDDDGTAGLRTADAPAPTAPSATAAPDTTPDTTAPTGPSTSPTTAGAAASTTAPLAPTTAGTPTTSGAPPATTVPPTARDAEGPFAGLAFAARDDAGGPATATGAAVEVAAGAWLAFDQVRFGSGLATSVELVATPGPGAGTGAVVELRLDDVASPPFATVAVSAPAGEPVTLTAPTSAAIGGTHDIYVTVAAPRPGTVATLDRLRFVP